MIPSVCVSTLCAIFFIFYFQQHQHHHQYSNMDTNMTNLTSSTTTNTSAKDDQQQQQLFDTTGKHQRQIMQQQQHYQEHFQQAQQAAARNQLTAHLPLRFNPLTPPGLPQAILPASPHFYTHSMDDTYNSILTPRHTPPMDITPPKSPISPTVTPTDHYQQQQQHHDQQQQDQELMSNSSEDLKNIADSDGEENTHLPIYNSHGKMKTHQCKKCDSVTITKWSYYEHLKTHMNPDKILQCHKCPFVTELKHHLEYHIRKHTNLKPFQCDKCSYSGVNKSMLNSHRKSHSSVYQYSCIDCDYSTKYCHSFKLHLRKYSHQPGMVLDEDGIPNPSVVIDVYGTRRGPKRKSRNNLKMSAHHHQQPQLPAALQSIPLNSHSQQNQMPTSPPKSSSSVIDEVPALTLNMSLQQQKNQQQEQQTQKQQQEKQEKQNQQQQNQQQQQESENSSQNYNIPNLFSPLASLLQQNSNMAFVHLFNINLQMLAAQQQAAVLAHLSPGMREELQKYQEQNTQESENLKNDGDCEGDGDDNDGEDAKEEEADERMEVSTATNSHTNNSPTPTASSSGNSSNSLSTASNGLTAYSSPAATPTMYECKYCDISFKNAVLYHIHMGYHSCDDVFKCNMCGEKCDGPVGLFVHIAHYAHS